MFGRGGYQDINQGFDMADTTNGGADVGPPVNYARIDDAVSHHKDLLARVEALAATQVLAQNGARCFLTVDGDKGMPLEVAGADAAALFDVALTDATNEAAELGSLLTTLSMGLPS